MLNSLLIPILFLILTIISCQTKQEIELCVGDYFTEAEAKVKLREYAASYNNTQEWRTRVDRIKNNIIEGTELDQIPQVDRQFPISVTRNNKRVFDGYTVENLALEVRPGHFVTGNLYQPDSINGKIPAILCPHGHWSKPEDYGRFRDDMQLRSASLAKMGAVVISYDMYGYGEDVQHFHRDPKALKWQTFNGIRILDYISSMDFVDTTRIAITGASGGGTQSFVLAAIDDRIDVSVPVVMVSAHFFGGCVCESGMPIHKKGTHETNNVEIAASIAPKPLMLISDGDDWTRNVPEVEFPHIQNIYRMFGASDKVEFAHYEDEVHDYGPSKRKSAYAFLAKHLKLDYESILDKNGAPTEDFVQLQDTTELKVFPQRPLVQDPGVERL